MVLSISVLRPFSRASLNVVLKSIGPAVLRRAAFGAVANNLAHALREGYLGRLRVARFALGTGLLGALDPAGLATALFAFIVGVEERAFGADDPAALVTVDLGAMLAYQWANSRGPELDGIECIGSRARDIQVGVGMFVEQRQRMLQRLLGRATAVRGQAADPTQLASNRFSQVGLGRCGLQ